jgi:4'-phosphopantetheinyl transferase
MSPDEIDGAGRFHREADRRRFVLCRGALRVILGRYTASSPAGIVLGRGPRGKPRLSAGVSGGCERSLEFNVSHSGDIAVVALASDHAVGVDVEPIRALPEADRLAARFFSANEYAQYMSLDPAAHLEAFFRCWTRKEAFIKALGEGLSLSLQSFDVTLTPHDRAQILRIDGAPGEERQWSLHDFEPAAGYAAAVAVRIPEVTLSSFALCP